MAQDIHIPTYIFYDFLPQIWDSEYWWDSFLGTQRRDKRSVAETRLGIQKILGPIAGIFSTSRPETTTLPNETLEKSCCRVESTHVMTHRWWTNGWVYVQKGHMLIKDKALWDFAFRETRGLLRPSGIAWLEQEAFSPLLNWRPCSKVEAVFRMEVVKDPKRPERIP